MERFEIKGESGLQLFANFVSKAKDAIVGLGDNIKESIKLYEENIESAEKQIADAVSSREKCEHEISKMEGKIDTIKEAIDNVESTYKKMVDAYSSTSKGDTKDIYSDIISAARVNCEKDVEKNRSEIARLNSDIEAIKNNIQEFDKVITDLNRNVESYKIELDKYARAYSYLDKVTIEVAKDLDDISEGVKVTSKPKTSTPKKTTKEPEKKIEKKEEVKEESPVIEETQDVIKDETIEMEPVKGFEIETGFEEPVKEETPISNANPVIDESLQRIYDLTGYKPKEENTTIQEPTIAFEPVREQPIIIPQEEVEDKKVEPLFENNLENLFATPSADVKKEEPAMESYNDADMSEWEKILNGSDDMFATDKTPMEEAKPEPIVIDTEVKSTIDNSAKDTVDELLRPYGTTYDRLSSLIGDSISYKNGTSFPFIMSVEDVARAINSIDGNDLRAMKVVGPEITIIRRVKAMKEGK